MEISKLRHRKFNLQENLRAPVMSFSATEEIMKSCHLTSNEFMSRLFHQLTDISPVIFFLFICEAEL